MRKRTTAKEVALVAGVSKWTVIRAFTPGAPIGDDSRRRVLKAAEDLDYRPNLLARSLATTRTLQVAVLVDDFANPYKWVFLEKLTEKIQEAGLVAVLININLNFDQVHAILTADQRQIDAVILFDTAFRDNELENRCLGSGLPPMYVLARDSQIDGMPSVVCDAEVALKDIVSYLHARGYRRPGYLAGTDVLAAALGRRVNFELLWKKEGVSLASSIVAEKCSMEAGAGAMRGFLASTPADQWPDVLMCDNDVLAMGAMDIARSEFGLRVPEDIAFVGFDNLALAGTPGYQLTSYEQPRDGMIDAIIGMIAGTQPRKAVSLQGRLVLRSSA